MKNIFLQNYAENEAGRLFPDLFLFYIKPLYKVKEVGILIAFNLALNKHKLYKTSYTTDLEICSILIF